MSYYSGDTQFQKLLAGRCDIDLIQLMLEFAADAYPDLDRVGCLLEIDRLSVSCEVANRSAVPCNVRHRLSAISRVLYEIEGFHGNREGYYEPENSYLNEVLARRCGIPISLGILYMGIASRVGLRTFGVNTPGHFLIGCRTEGGAVFIDPFNGGDLLDRQGCQRRIEEMTGQKCCLTDDHFRPAHPREIAARVLRNLKAAYAIQNRWPMALPVQQRLVELLPQYAQERRDLGLLYLRSGQPRKALSLLEEYRSCCTADHLQALESTIRAARKLVAELN